MNNIALLAHNVSTMAADPHRLAEQAVDLAKTAGVILCLCSTGAVAAARTVDWQHLIQRNLWLQQTPGIPEPMRRQLLECPISPDVLFGPRLSSMVDDMQAASEEAEKFRRHVSRPPPGQQRHRPPAATVSHCGSSSWPPGLPAPPASIAGCGERPAKALASGLMGLCPAPQAPAKAITGRGRAGFSLSQAASIATQRHNGEIGRYYKGPALCLDFQRGAAFYTFQKGPALYLPFPRGSAIQTFQKGPSLYLAFVFADASTSPSSSPMPATFDP
ncbi:unnamed protein product [Boreogadus saida]